jgi:hypothetical protein
MARSLQLTFRRAVAGYLLLATAALALTAAGCGETPAPPRGAASVESDPLPTARAAMERRDYRAAAELLRRALVKHPADLDAHYRLGVSASHLDRQDEAVRAFEWVVAHGASGVPEVEMARDWLTAQRGPRPADSVPVTPARQLLALASTPAKPDLAILTGRAVGADGVKARLQLFLKGLPDTPVKDEYHLLRTDQQGNFRFADVVPGEYMLTNAIAGPRLWRLRVSLGKGERLVLDLSPANQATVRDDFPEPRS